MIKFTFFFDDDIKSTHAEKHLVSSEELNEFFTTAKYFIDKRKDGSLVAIGKLNNGRYLEVAYRQISKYHIHIITAYDIKELYLIEFIESNLDH